jgi:hypothetical protein
VWRFPQCWTVSPETVRQKWQETQVSKFRRFQCFKVFETLKLCDLETLLSSLLADAEFSDDGFVALGIVFLKVVEQATPLADQHEKAAARAVVFLVRLEVFRQLANAFAQQRYLDLRAAGIAGMRAVLVNHGFLVLSG